MGGRRRTALFDPSAARRMIGSRPSPGREEPEIEEVFDRVLEEGHDRLERPAVSLGATGALGGIDVAVGVLAYLQSSEPWHGSVPE